MDIGPSEAETLWTAFLRKLARLGLRGVKLVISDASKVLTAAWQRCRVHFMSNALAHAGKSGRRVVSAFIATAFAQEDAEAARQQWRKVADQLRPKLPKLAALMDDAEQDVLAFMTFSAPAGASAMPAVSYTTSWDTINYHVHPRRKPLLTVKCSFAMIVANPWGRGGVEELCPTRLACFNDLP